MTATTVLAGQQLSLKNLTDGTFRTESMIGVEPLSDGESYTQISADGKQIVKFSFKTGKQTGVLFDASKARGAKIERVDGYSMSPDGRTMLIQTQTKSIYRHSFTAVYYIFTIANNKLEPLSDGGPQQIPVWSPDGTQIAFVRDNNIFLVKLLYNNSESQVTKDGKFNEVINGLPDWVNEEEFSFNSSLVFSADSKQIVWVRYDESSVKQYSMPLFKGMKPVREEYSTYPGFYTYKYPKAGEDNAKVKVMSYDIKSHQTRTMQLPLDADGYIPRIKATSDPTKIAVFTLNRHQDNLKVFMANPMSTVCQQVIDDKVDKYINENVFANLVFTDKHIVLTSERSGFNSIYVYGLNGQLQRTVQQGVITDVYGYDEATGDIYYAALNNGPTDKKVFVSHKNGKTDCLTPKSGWNSAIVSNELKNFVHTWSDANTPPVYSLCNNQGKTVTTFIDNKKAAEKYASFDMGTKEFFTFQTSEGTTLYGYMVKPKNFDANKKYPVVMFQYGGPGSQQVKNAWGIGMSGNSRLHVPYRPHTAGFHCLGIAGKPYVHRLIVSPIIPGIVRDESYRSVRDMLILVNSLGREGQQGYAIHQPLREVGHHSFFPYPPQDIVGSRKGIVGLFGTEDQGTARNAYPVTVSFHTMVGHGITRLHLQVQFHPVALLPLPTDGYIAVHCLHLHSLPVHTE